MFTVLRGIFIVLTFLKYGITAGFVRVIAAFLAYKLFMVIVIGVIMPIIFVYVSLKINGYVISYVLDYVETSVSLEGVPLAYEITGVAAYLFDALGLAQAFSVITTCATIRMALRISVLRGN